VIFVTTGISGAPFDRLLREIDRIEGDEPMVVQHGPSTIRPRRGQSVGFLTFSELDDLMASARVVITHGGAGSVLVALRHDIRPIVVPRLPQFGEVVDDHQLLFARRLAEAGLVRLVENPTDLPAALAAEPAQRIGHVPRGSQLTDDLADYLADVMGETTVKDTAQNGTGAVDRRYLPTLRGDDDAA